MFGLDKQPFVLKVPASIATCYRSPLATMSDESKSPAVMWDYESDSDEDAQTSRPLAAELPASASGEGGATSARGHEASEQKFIAEVENEKSEHIRSTALAWLNEKGDANKTKR